IWQREQALPAVREPLERYAAGINAWIDQCRRTGRAAWPIELQRLHRTPDPWRPEDAYLVLLAQGMLLDPDLPELDEAGEIRAHGLAWEVARQRFEQDMTVPTIPDSVADRMYGRRPKPTLPGSPYSEGAKTGARIAPDRGDGQPPAPLI